MADSKISDLTAKTTLAGTEEFVIADSGASKKITASDLESAIGSGSGGIVTKIYDYTVTGSDASSIDTNVDGGDAGLFATDGYEIVVVLMGRTDEAVQLSIIDWTFNNDTGANYSHGIFVSSTASTTISMSHSAGLTKLQTVLPGSSMDSSVPGSARLVIPAYADTTFYKAGEIKGGAVNTTVSSNSNRQWRDGGFVYASTSAITRVAVTPDTSGKKLLIGTRLMVFKKG
jgi:hypothetical protein